MLILVFILIGITAGYMLRNIKALKIVDRTITVTICTLLFILGLTVGGNHEMLKNIGIYGGQAFIICCAGLVGSILFTYIVSTLFFKDIKNEDDNQ